MTKQTFPSTVQIAGDLGGTPASPQVTGAHFGGSDGQYMIRRSGLWAPATPAYTDLSGIPSTFTPSAHASTHDLTGTDPVRDLTRLAAGPAVNGYTAWTFDPNGPNATYSLAAGWIYMMKLETAHAYVISTIDFWIKTGGTGVTALANCFIGIYDSGGTRRYVSADQSSAWASSGAKSLSLGGTPYTVTANDFIYIAILIGTQATTPCVIQGVPVSTSAHIGLTAANFRFVANGSGFTALPSTQTLSSNAATNSALFFGVK